MSTQAFAPPAAAPKKPSLAGVIIGIVLMVVGPVVGIVLIITSAFGSVSGVTSAPTYQSDGTPHQVRLTAGQGTGIWMVDAAWNNGVDCQVTDPSGNDVVLVQSAISQNVGNYTLTGFFTPLSSGQYTVACTGASVDPYRVAPLVAVRTLAGGLIIGILTIIVTFLAGLILLIVTAVRRGNWTSKYGPKPPSPIPPAYGAQPMPYGQPYPAPGQPPYGAPNPVAPPYPQAYPQPPQPGSAPGPA
ncbi:MAG: hypothetical protein FWF36_09635 [Propionibacteriaceae bacterium]|nr:hypothetical protein [Propionibacteriaceae bacterium]